MSKLTELLSQRRVWSTLVSVGAFIALWSGVEVPDQVTLVNLLTAFGTALATLVGAGLTLWSYVKPKK